MPRDSAAIAGAPDEAGGQALIEVLSAHGIPAELRAAGSGFVDVVVPRDLRDEARKLLKAHLAALARDEEPEVIAVVPDPAAGFALSGALRAAGFPVTTQRGAYASRQTTGILVPHAMVAAAREFVASLEADGTGAEPLQDGSQAGREESSPGEGGVQIDAAEPACEAEPAVDATGVEGPAHEVPPADEAEPAAEGPPAYASDLKPDFGDDFGPHGGL